MNKEKMQQIASDLETHSYQYWLSQPLTFDDLPSVVTDYQETRDGVEIQVEIMLLENTDQYIQLSVNVDDGSWPWYIGSYSAVINRDRSCILAFVRSLWNRLSGMVCSLHSSFLKPPDR